MSTDLVIQQNQSLFSRIQLPLASSPVAEELDSQNQHSLEIVPLPQSTGPVIPKHNRRQLFIMTSAKSVNTDQQSSVSAGGSTKHDSPTASQSSNSSTSPASADIQPFSATSPFDFDSASNVFKYNQKSSAVKNVDTQISKEVVKKTRVSLAKSHCFLVILRHYAAEHKPHEVAKLQLLNKRCYDYFVPQLMSQQKLKLEMSPCLLNFFEADVQKQIVDKKECGTKMRNGHVLTLKFDRDFPRNKDAVTFVNQYLETHPNFAELFQWTGEHWQILCHRYTRSTVFKFVSKNVSTKEGTFYTKIRVYDQKQVGL